ncbi:low-complexity tail membrane protein [Trichothermofontia sichuanensis B231]|uniref:low-complexity tail membrane protein n=1 Tax=Trichothermofontia sichuanensis TaxID=3045816 RepID=UPI002247F752|nr:low-complexity tail membrane protein [Trichothermofontia sichuanensis]UZQ53724.1 low-complexity tail membrane protein [Trichothermofontia sichuanensis B231]
MSLVKSEFKSEPFLWIHLAGLAAVPIWLELGWLGLATGSPLLPVPLEVGIVALVGGALPAGMQLVRPFYIFSIPGLILRAGQLAKSQRQILRQLYDRRNYLIILAVPLVWAVIVWQLYRLAPLVSRLSPLPASWHVVGLAIAIGAFTLANLMTQVPLAVLQVLLTPEAELAALEPYPTAEIAQDFTRLGWPVDRIPFVPTPLATDEGVEG